MIECLHCSWPRFRHLCDEPRTQETIEIEVGAFLRLLQDPAEMAAEDIVACRVCVERIAAICAAWLAIQ